MLLEKIPFGVLWRKRKTKRGFKNGRKKWPTGKFGPEIVVHTHGHATNEISTIQHDLSINGKLGRTGEGKLKKGIKTSMQY